MKKTLDRIKRRSWVAHVDDERSIGNSIIVTLADNWCFRDDPTCGVCGFDTVSEAYAGTAKKACYTERQ